MLYGAIYFLFGDLRAAFFILTTNLKFAGWVQLLGDERLTAALFHCLTHYVLIIEPVSENPRF